MTVTGNGVKLCRKCELPLAGLTPRTLYHPECKELARKESQERSRDEARKCGKCRRVKVASAFSNDSTRATGKYPYCKECQNSMTIGNSLQDSEAEPNGHICPLCDTVIRGHANRRFCSNKCKERTKALREFGLTVTEYRAMIDATGGRCPICKNRCYAWQIDHNHKTRRVTGVVCAPCNIGPLAYSNHDIEKAGALLSYLLNTPAQQLGIDAVVSDLKQQPSQLHHRWGHKRKS